jgi:hypothetical protein
MAGWPTRPNQIQLTGGSPMKPMDESRVASVKTWIKDHPVAAFLLMLYPVEWIIFVPVLLGKSGFGIISIDIPY